MNLKYVVEKEMSINQILSERFKISTRLKNKLIKNKCILKNGSFEDTRNVCNIGDVITILLDMPEDNSNIVPNEIPLNIVYEDKHLIAINKPAGLAVHPSILHFDDSLSNGIKYYFDSINLKKKIRPVNRIDLNTSGLVLFAKNEYVQECLIRQMTINLFRKTYLCVVDGKFESKSGIIDLPISRKPDSIIERCVASEGQSAKTHYEVLKEFNNYSLVECNLETGRTHQIRVHMSYNGHPLLGDSLYNKNDNVNSLIYRQALHSHKMEFIHPITQEKVLLEADIPEDMKKLII